MGDNTGIEWADATWNPIRARHAKTKKVGHHCEHVSEGCRFCYAERLNAWRGTGFLYKPSLIDDGTIELFLDEAVLDLPRRWRRPRTIFPCSMTDLFGRFVPDEWIMRLWSVMAGAKHHRFIVLTKRAARMRALLDRIKPDGDGWSTLDGRRAMDGGHAFITSPAKWPLRNVILGVSAEDQATFDARVEELGRTPAAKRIVSLEPLLGPIDTGNAFDRAIEPYEPLDGAIVGGESGPGARPPHPEWVRAIRDQVKAAGGAFFFKQWGEWRQLEYADYGRSSCARDRWAIVNLNGEVWHRPPGLTHLEQGNMIRVGKKAAGRTLDGRIWEELP